MTISIDYWIAPKIGHKESDIHQRAANSILEGCLKNGGLYIKLGQGLAAVNHILPKEYVNTLNLLQDKCLTRKINELEEIIVQDFGKKPEELFQSIEKEPVAAASLAQVYKGKAKDGEEVAIKVQYFDLRDRFEADMKTLNFLLKIISLIHPKFNLHWVLNELYDTLAQELDFELEAKNGERCAHDLKKFTYANVPKIRWDLTTKRVLTAEWIDGIKITNIEELKKNGIDIDDMHKKLITLMAEQIFHTGFVHADPHAGNLLIRKGKDKKAQIVLLDHGLYEHLPEKSRISLCNFWESMVLRDYSAMRKFAKELKVEDPFLLAEVLTQAPFIIPAIETNTGNLTAEEYMIKQAQERFDRITEMLKTMPKSMMLTIRNLNTVRSIMQGYTNPHDRYKLMARIAVRGKYSVLNQSYTNIIPVAISKARFEFRLWLHGFAQWMFKMYFSVLHWMGYDIQRVFEFIA
ncbi:uncharacterized aarF domain-containing protein kinase 5 isoform X2 [Prorops nasuta]